MFSIIKSDNTTRQIIGIADNDVDIYNFICNDSGVQNVTQYIQTFTDLINNKTKIINFNDYLYNNKTNSTFTHYQIEITGEDSCKYIKTNKKCVYEIVLSLPQFQVLNQTQAQAKKYLDLLNSECESVKEERDNIKSFSFIN